MLNSDLARLYGCANGTKTINQAVKRHINKFPERYMFQLTTDEISMKIIDAFVCMRKYISKDIIIIIIKC